MQSTELFLTQSEIFSVHYTKFLVKNFSTVSFTFQYSTDRNHLSEFHKNMITYILWDSIKILLCPNLKLPN